MSVRVCLQLDEIYTLRTAVLRVIGCRFRGVFLILSRICNDTLKSTFSTEKRMKREATLLKTKALNQKSPQHLKAPEKYAFAAKGRNDRIPGPSIFQAENLLVSGRLYTSWLIKPPIYKAMGPGVP